MVYFYQWSYCPKDDTFFAFVDDGSRTGDTIFQIDDTEEVCEYIRDGQMTHIDDVEGLEEYLKQKGLMQEEDSLLFREENIW